MQDSSNFNFPLILTVGFAKYIGALRKEGNMLARNSFTASMTAATVPSSGSDVHFQSRRPVLEFVRVIEIRTAGGAGVGPWNGGKEAQRNIEGVFGFEVPPVEDDFPADDFVGIDLAGLDQFFELIVPDFQTTRNSHDGHRSGDRLIALVGDGYDGFGDTSLLNL